MVSNLANVPLMFSASVDTECESDPGTSRVFSNCTMWKLVPSSFAGIEMHMETFS